MELSFSIKEALKEQAKNNFFNFSSIKVKNLINKSICKEACEYIYDNEIRIINKYKDDPNGFSVDLVDRKSYIKYFEFPFRENAKIFGQFVTSDVFRIAEHLLDSPVYLKSLEVHSRCAKGTSIPPHQDNAYYGLKNGKGLTFYIPINNEFASMGGLKYYKNPPSIELEHVPCNSSGFSLTINKSEELNFDVFKPNYLPGDCTIHHSRSIHFAEEVPSNAERSLVVRLSIYAINEFEKDGHAEWYRNMIKLNRENVSNSLNKMEQ